MQVPSRRKFVVIAIVLLCLFAAGIVMKSLPAPSSASAEASDSTGQNEAAYAAVVPVLRQTVTSRLSIAGQFLPYQNVELHAKVAGYIQHIYVDIGDHVRAGQVLAVLEIPELVAQVDEAQAAVHHAEEEIERARSNVARAVADNVALHANAERLEKTNQTRPGLIAQQELDDATAKDRASQAQVDAAKSALAAARQQLEVAKANLKHYAALHQYARITSPYDGVVTWRFSDTGSLVQAGTSNNSGLPVVTVAEVDVLRLRIPVPESLAAKVRVGDEAEVRVSATGEQFGGKVTRYTDALDPSTRTMQVEIDVANPHYHLQPGMYAEVRLDAARHAGALTVPVEAVERQGEQTKVLVVNREHRVESRAVQVGVESASRVEVLAGLQEGETVIVGNLGSYQPGELVRPKPRALAMATSDF